MHKKIISGFGFLAGVSYPFKAIKVIAENRRLWQYLIIPVLINLIIGIATYIWLLKPSLNSFDILTNNLLLSVEQALNNLPEWLAWLFYLTAFFTSFIKVTLLILLFVLIGFIITQFGGILGSPWYGKLSEQIEIISKGKLEIIEIHIFHDLWRAILFEFKKLMLIIFIGLPLLLVNFLPAFGGIIATIGWISLTTTIVCLDFFDAPLERRRLKFRKKLKFVWQNIPATAGFGLICLALVTIPFLNLIVIPLCVSAGTLFVCDRAVPVGDRFSQSQNFLND